MEENLTSSETLHQEMPETGRGRRTAFGDTLTVQTILCVLMAIGFVVTNIMNGGLAADIFVLYQNKVQYEGDDEELLRSAADYVVSLYVNDDRAAA